MIGKDSGAGSIVPFVLGIGVGAVAAFLLAPKTGKRLRSDIGEGVSAAADQIGTSGKELKQRIEKLGAQAEGHLHDVVQAGQNAYQQTKNA